MAEVKSHSTLFNNLSNSQNVQILENIVNQAGADIETIPELAPSYTDVKQDLTSLDGAFRHGKALYETKEVAGKDSGRDYITRSIASRVASYANYPQSEQEKEEAGRLQFIVDTYKNADRKEYESETTFIRRFIVELRKYPALLVKYGINTMVWKLKTTLSTKLSTFAAKSAFRSKNSAKCNLFAGRSITRSAGLPKR